jgi:hypothetical protein
MSPVPPSIDSRKGFGEAVAWGFDAAFAERARRIVCVDADFVEWPLDDERLLQGLVDWLRLPQRRLDLLARHYDELPRRCPRFTRWRQHWTHAIGAWQAPAESAVDLPTVLVSDGAISVQLVDALHGRCRAASDPASARTWIERIDVVLQRSEVAFAANTLGL